MKKVSIERTTHTLIRIFAGPMVKLLVLLCSGSDKVTVYCCTNSITFIDIHYLYLSYEVASGSDIQILVTL